MEILLYPYFLLKFWYVEAVIGLVKFFISLDRYIANLLSLPLFVKTFFKPLKNEYRKDLVGFSIGMGIFVKSVLIAVDVAVLCLFVISEIIFLCVFLLFPFGYLVIMFLINRLSAAL